MKPILSSGPWSRIRVTDVNGGVDELCIYTAQKSQGTVLILIMNMISGTCTNSSWGWRC